MLRSRATRIEQYLSLPGSCQAAVEKVDWRGDAAAIQADLAPPSGPQLQPRETRGGWEISAGYWHKRSPLLRWHRQVAHTRGANRKLSLRCNWLSGGETAIGTRPLTDEWRAGWPNVKLVELSLPDDRCVVVVRRATTSWPPRISGAPGQWWSK